MPEFTPLEVFRSAREIIAKPGRWTQGTTARDEEGRAVYPSSWYAVRFCPIGAMEKAIHKAYFEPGQPKGAMLVDPRNLLYQCRDIMRNVVYKNPTKGDYLSAWNDRQTRTQAEVVDAFDRTITKLQKQATRRAKK